MGSFVKRLIKGLGSVAKSFLTKAQQDFNASVQGGDYDLAVKIATHPWDVSNDPQGGHKARSWLLKWVKQRENKQYINQRGLLEQGKLYMFNYINPATKDTLPWWDKNPLVLCLGQHKTKEGRILDVGINLHHLPLKVRKQVLIKIFDMYRKKYRGEMYRDKSKSIPVRWETIAIPLMQYGADFAFRSYYPNRRTKTIEFPYEEFHNAIFIPSEAYSNNISKQKLDKLWKEHLLNRSLKKVSPQQLARALGGFQ